MEIAVSIPAYKVSKQILPLLAKIGPEVKAIFVVDDACNEGSGKLIEKECHDPRVKVIFQEKNSGVGAATLRGFHEAEKAGFAILVKLDGDGQMDPSFIRFLTKPIREGKADYTKGNRFYSPRFLAGMPVLRLLGNAGIGFLAKLTTGYWNISDPTNGYIALHSSLLPILETERISKRYFFENDLLFRLSLLRAVVVDVPMKAHYADEKSNLSISHTLVSFPGKFFVRFLKRVVYRYFLRDFHMGTILLLAGTVLLCAGGGFGAYHWMESTRTGVVASSGTVMLAALPVLLGFQMLTFTLLFDVLMTPKDPIFPNLENS